MMPALPSYHSVTRSLLVWLREKHPIAEIMGTLEMAFGCRSTWGQA